MRAFRLEGRAWRENTEGYEYFKPTRGGEAIQGGEKINEDIRFSVSNVNF